MCAHNTMLKCFGSISFFSSKPRRLFSSLLVKSEHIFNQNMNLKVGSPALSALNFFNLASMDAQAQSRSVEDYLTAVESNATKFLEGDSFFDREELVAAVSKLLVTKGEFGLLLGGKNTGLLSDIISFISIFYIGKSFLLKHLQRTLLGQQKDRFVIVFDGRASGGNLQLAIKKGLESVSLFHKYKDVAKSSLNTLGKLVTLDFDVKFPAASEIDSLEKIIKVAQAKHLFPVLLFDEANTLFTNKQVLDYLVKYAKETREITVLFASSEYSYPLRLKELKFNLTNITTTIFAGEVPPLDMLDLLQKKWGMGSNLAAAFVNVYGGHIQLASFGVSQLALNKEAFMPSDVLPLDIFTGIIACIKAELSGDAKLKGTIDILRQIAISGGCPLMDASDPRAEQISRLNVGGVVGKVGTVVGVPKSAFGNFNWALVPAFQVVRLMIALTLNQMDLEGQGRNQNLNLLETLN